MLMQGIYEEIISQKLKKDLSDLDIEKYETWDFTLPVQLNRNNGDQERLLIYFTITCTLQLLNSSGYGCTRIL